MRRLPGVYCCYVLVRVLLLGQYRISPRVVLSVRLRRIVRERFVILVFLLKIETRFLVPTPSETLCFY